MKSFILKVEFFLLKIDIREKYQKREQAIEIKIMMNDNQNEWESETLYDTFLNTKFSWRKDNIIRYKLDNIRYWDIFSWVKLSYIYYPVQIDAAFSVE